jgi:nucleotide-binding universal stress UspA family protein
MNIGLFVDNTMPLALDPLCELLNSSCRELRFSAGDTAFRLAESTISYPSTYEDLPPKLTQAASGFDLACISTSIPYENNHFFQGPSTCLILSFAGWNALTDLPVTNGLVYFLASIIADEFGIGSTHDTSIGCLNDFLWDKGGVDIGMRAAFVCQECLAVAPQDAKTQRVVTDIQAILDAVSRASREHMDILAVDPSVPAPTPDRFDVFLCHNSADKPAVRLIDTAMQQAGVRTWLDEDQLRPGVPWQEELEAQIADVKAAVVFVGESGLGPWQDAEMRAFLNQFRTRGCPVIPVLLPDAPAIPDLPLFLAQMTWVDLRTEYEPQLERLIRALRT